MAEGYVDSVNRQPSRVNLRNLPRLGQRLGLLAHLRGALDFVPREGLAVDGALDGAEQDHRKHLAVGEALQPDVEQQPLVALVGGVRALKTECDGRGDEVDDQEAEEVGEQLFKAGRDGGS